MSETTSRTAGRTYRGTAEAGSPRLAGLPDVHQEQLAPEQVLEIERYDTADRRLAAAGIALAVLRGDGPAQWQLDLPDGTLRERLRVPIPADDAAAPALPADLRLLIRGATRGDAVSPAARARISRQRTRLLDANGRELAALVRDQLSLATLGESTEVAAWTEVQLRVGSGAPVEQLERRLAEAGLQPADPAVETELDRMLRPPPRVRRTGRPDSAGAALVEYLATHTDRLAAEDLRVRRGEPDSVHQLRVASRRMRSALQAFRPLLDRERTGPVIADLRDFAQELSPARDAEVLNERITAALAALEPQLLIGPVQAQVTRHFARVEAEAGAAVLTALDGPRYARLRSALEELVANPPLTKRAGRAATQELPTLVARTARRLERAVTVAIDPEMDQVHRDLAVHDARKAGKRLRYATEVVQPVIGTKAQRFAKALKGFQNALGEHQDTVVAREVLRQLGAAAENGFSFGLLHAQDAAFATRIEEQLPQLWAAAWTPRNVSWLTG